jgi:hypothetical protein
MKNLSEFLKSFSWKILNWFLKPKNTVFLTGRLFFLGGFGGGIFLIVL